MVSWPPTWPGSAIRRNSRSRRSSRRCATCAETPSLAAWFAGGDAAATAELAQGSPVIAALGLSVVGDQLAARWVVRVIVSLLIVPGRDAAEERAIVERFVVPSLSASVSSP